MFSVSLKTIIINFDLVLCMLDLSAVIMFSIVNLFNSLGAIVAQARREKVRRDRETNNGRSRRAKTLAIRAKYSTNKGLSMDPLLVFSYEKIIRRNGRKVSQFFTLTNNTRAEFDSGISYQGIEGQNNQ